MYLLDKCVYFSSIAWLFHSLLMQKAEGVRREGGEKPGAREEVFFLFCHHPMSKKLTLLFYQAAIAFLLAQLDSTRMNADAEGMANGADESSF